MTNPKALLRRSIYVVLGSFDSVFGRENAIVIYCYHNIVTNHWVYNVSPKAFADQMNFLSQWGSPVTLSDIEKYIKTGKKLPPKAFAITFDDGYRNLLATIPVFKEHGITPTVFPLSDYANVVRREIGTESNLLGPKDLLSLTQAGWDIGSHGMSHKNLLKSPADEVDSEIRISKILLEKTLGKNITAFAYPHGRYNPGIIASVKKSGYTLGLSMDDGFITRKTRLFEIPRVGVMGNHSMLEFKYLASPSVIYFRNFVKRTPFRKFI